MIESCPACQRHRNKLQKETLIPHNIPPRVWTKVGTDIFHCLNKNYVVVVDYTSKFFDMHNLPDMRASTVINKTKSIFARYGIPEEVISDNGSQYSSQQYRSFSKAWNFKHTTSSPEFPQSNGLVERTIQTIKRALKKCKESNSDPYLAILTLRTTTNSTNTSPDEVLMNRKLRTTLPRMPKSHMSNAELKASEKTNILQRVIKQRYDENSRNLKPLQAGQTIRYHHNGTWSRHATIIDQPHTRSYNLLNDNGKIIRRNLRQIIPSRDKFVISPAQVDAEIGANEDTPNQGANEDTPCQVTTRSGRVIRKPKRFRQ